MSLLEFFLFFIHLKTNLLHILLWVVRYVLGTAYTVVSKTNIFPSLMELEKDNKQEIK
jgi:hypothetical protein